MDLHVSCQLGALGTRVVTLITSVRLLSGVRSNVNSQVGSVLKDFAAEFACVVLVPTALHRLNASLLGDLSQQTRLHPG